MSTDDSSDPLSRYRARFASATRGVDAPVVVGCSGGADSVALLALSVDAGLAPVAVHVDHGIRPESRHEHAAVAALAARLGTRCDARAVCVASGANLEARARDARYRALEHARRAHGASAVLVAHTADDQAETVLLNVLRGAAASGLAGMPAARGSVVRPLLGFRRSETGEVCAALGLPVLHDPMNDDDSFRRVAVRRRVLPLLERVAGRDLVPVLARQAAILRDESDYLDELGRAAWPGPEGTTARDLAALPPVLARRAVRQWLGTPPPSGAEVARVLEVASGARRSTELAGCRTVRRSSGRLSLERHD
ncbi:MAG TPA: tRNA lysidine(34) synthetase TilS [Acidimicrobiia bacterium]|nr:tRNA lysidine(34) synthetase TilS [Acidimicrobiia bacterium]